VLATVDLFRSHLEAGTGWEGKDGALEREDETASHHHLLYRSPETGNGGV